MTHVAPRIVNNVSFVSRINHEIHFAWQAQYLVSLDNAKRCIFQYKMRVVGVKGNLGCEAGCGLTVSLDPPWVSFVHRFCLWHRVMLVVQNGVLCRPLCC